MSPPLYVAIDGALGNNPQADRTRYQPDISNNVGPVKLFLNTLLSFHLKEFFSFAFFLLGIDDHGSLVI
jgi:hypothetical protein